MTEDPAPDPIIQRAFLLYEHQRYPEAESLLRDSLQQDPEDSSRLHLLALSVFAQDERENEALEVAEDAIRHDPENALLHTTRSRILSVLDRPKDALVSADKAISLDPFLSHAFSTKAQALSSVQRWSEAEEAARHALALDPDNDSAGNLLARTLRMQKKYADNEEQLDSLLSRNPENPYTHVNKGWSCLEQGKRSDAESHFREALRLDPNNESARVALIESFRARSPLYRINLRFSFFMQRMTILNRFALLGLIILFNLTNVLVFGAQPFVLIALAIWVLFALWTHIARAVGNLIILRDSLAAHALLQSEKIEAIIVGGSVIVATCLGVTFLFLPIDLVGFSCIALIAASLPLSYVFTNDSPLGKKVFLGITLLIYLAAIWGILSSGIEEKDTAILLILLGMVASGWLSSTPQLRR